VYLYFFSYYVFSYIGHNKISSLPTTYGGRDIIYLDVSYNRITYIPSSFFSGAYGSSSINFSNNQIQSLPELSSSMSCTSLIFSYNNITVIPKSFSSSNLQALFVLAFHQLFFQAFIIFFTNFFCCCVLGVSIITS